jgi:hypothetical protein
LYREERMTIVYVAADVVLVLCTLVMLQYLVFYMRDHKIRDSKVDMAVLFVCVAAVLLKVIQWGASWL